MSCSILCIARFSSFRIICDPSWHECVAMSDCGYSKRRFSPVCAVGSTSPRGIAFYFPHNANAVQRSSQADKPPVRWLGGGAAVGGSNCSAARRLQLAPSEVSFSRGSRRAAVGQAREAACSLE
jgi:hypothetical protein